MKPFNFRRTFILCCVLFTISGCSQNSKDKDRPTDEEVKAAITKMQQEFTTEPVKIIFENISFAPSKKGLLGKTLYPVKVKYTITSLTGGVYRTDKVDRVYEFARDDFNEWKPTDNY